MTYIFFCPLQKLLEAHEEQNSEAFTEAVSPEQPSVQVSEMRPSASVGIPAAEARLALSNPGCVEQSERQTVTFLRSLPVIHVPVVQDGTTEEPESL